MNNNLYSVHNGEHMRIGWLGVRGRWEQVTVIRLLCTAVRITEAEAKGDIFQLSTELDI